MSENLTTTTDKGNLAQPTKIVDATADDVLEYTKRARLLMAEDMTSQGIPQGRDRRVFLELLNDLDSQSLDSKRLDLDSKAADNDNEVALMAIRIRERHIKAVEKNAGIKSTEPSLPPVDESLLPSVTIDAAEFSCEIVEDDFDEFTKRHRPPED